MRLQSEDVVAVLDAVRDVNDVQFENDFPPIATRVVGQLVASDVTSFNEVDPVAGRAVAIMDPATFDISAYTEVFQRLIGEHPLVRYTMETGDGSARKISDFLSLDEFHDTAIYREVYSHLGVEHQMSITLPAVLPHIVAIAVNRSKVGDDFDERDRAMLDMLRPHLAQAYRFARERERLRTLLDMVGDALLADGTHAIALEDPPRELTPGALVMLYRFFGRPGVADALPARVSRWLAAQRDRQPGGRPIGNESMNLVRPIVSEREGRQMVMRYLPGGPVEALLLNERVQEAPAREYETLGLSPREAEVLALLTTGITNAAIAERLHVSPGTVKKHLDNVYRKLGVQGRVQAVAATFDLLA
jgi:DNA-binding CsgD family transcriptional regulator